MAGVISLELNELKFDYIEAYINAGELPAFKRLIEMHGVIKTEAEREYPYLEPWIQWPTVYTGMTYAEHGIFRLGDAVYKEHTQIWEYLEAKGLAVGAISPMNASNRCEKPSFFLPDPWTETPAVADPRVLKLYSLIKNIVNNNAFDQRSVMTLVRQLLPLSAGYINATSVPEYLRIMPHVLKHKWSRAAILDRLLADLFLGLLRSKRPGYASLFLNAAAHIQHHHMYDSAVYEGDRENPDWYNGGGSGKIDPLLFIYRTYDSIIRDMAQLPDMRLMITTGLSQYPNENDLYQYRLIDPVRVFNKFDLPSYELQTLMSRDFVLKFETETAAKIAQEALELFTCRGQKFFLVDNRGDNLFCQVKYHQAPDGLAEVRNGSMVFDASEEVVLVSIENGLHRTTGYHIDTGLTAAMVKIEPTLSLNRVFDRLAEAALFANRTVLSAGIHAKAG